MQVCSRILQLLISTLIWSISLISTLTRYSMCTVSMYKCSIMMICCLLQLTDTSLVVGGAIPLNTLVDLLQTHKDRSSATFPQLAEHLAQIANVPVRNVRVLPPFDDRLTVFPSSSLSRLTTPLSFDDWLTVFPSSSLSRLPTPSLNNSLTHEPYICVLIHPLSPTSKL